MSSDSYTTDAFTQLGELTRKRTALETLVKVAGSIHNQQKAMEELSLIARPSQEIPSKTVRNLEAFEQKHAALTDEALIQWLESIEETTQKLVEKVSQLANLDLQNLREKPIKGLSVEEFKDLTVDFQRRTHTSLALRFILKKRGVVLQAFKLPFPQESVADQVQALRKKEDECITQIRSEAVTIVQDTRALLSNKKLPDKVKEQLLSVQQAMKSNLAHLDQGGSVATIPNKFEVVILEANGPVEDKTPSAQTAKTPITPDPKPGSAPSSTQSSAKKSADRLPEPERQKRLSTFRLFLQWLTTPMDISWKSLKEENRKRDR